MTLTKEQRLWLIMSRLSEGCSIRSLFFFWERRLKQEVFLNRPQSRQQNWGAHLATRSLNSVFQRLDSVSSKQPQQSRRSDNPLKQQQKYKTTNPFLVGSGVTTVNNKLTKSISNTKRAGFPSSSSTHNVSWEKCYSPCQLGQNYDRSLGPRDSWVLQTIVNRHPNAEPSPSYCGS